MNQLNNNQLAVLPRRSRRLATIIPAAHWVSMGYSEVQAAAMERLQNDIKRYCDGGNETEIKLHVRGIRLPHHELMLPHWEKVAKSLSSSRHTSVTCLCIRGISLPPTVLDILSPALQSMNNLINLDLIRNGLGNDGFLHLSHFLNKNTRLQKLAILQNVIDDLSAAGSLSNAFKNHATLKRLVLSNCGLNNIPILEELLKGCTRMEALGITRNDFGSEGVSLIANFLHSNKTIGLLQLRGDKITDDDVLVLASVLKYNSLRFELNLRDNCITEEGEKALLNALFDQASMDSIVESNHTCVAYTFNPEPSIVAQRPPIETEVLDINHGDFTIGQKIRKKVALALCGVDGSLFDLSHFNDLPLQLMPRVLELMQEHSEARTREFRSMPVSNEVLDSLSVSFEQYQRKQLEKDALSRLFHTLRGWELPRLFENLNTSVTSGKRKRRRTRR